MSLAERALADTSAPARAGAPADYLGIRRVAKRFGGTTVLHDLSLGIGRGEFVSLLGPSGCGKTTLLRLIAGLLRPDAGTITVGGRELTRLPAHRRNVGVVFQSYALFPHLSVADNVAFGMRAQGRGKAEVTAQVERSLALVQMSAFADRPVTALSGGQQQRIAVARALAVEPALLLLDEPFSALDRKLRETMQIELRHLLRQLEITAIFVTHDQDEALIMSDRIAVMNAGQIEQLDTPTAVYARPESLYVLEFVGQSTCLAGRVTGNAGGEVEVETASGPLRAPGRWSIGAEVVVAVRPESTQLGEGSESGYNTIRLTVADIVFQGSRTMLHFAAVGAGDRLLAELSRLPSADIAPGMALPVRFRVADTMVFPKAPLG
jgi:putative spermidine/putrescine transport system ATP-binding protein